MHLAPLEGKISDLLVQLLLRSKSDLNPDALKKNSYVPFCLHHK